MTKFAFIIHPLALDDFTRKYSWAQKLPEQLMKKFTKVLPAFKAAHITGIKSVLGKEIEGYFIACPLTSQQMMTLPVRKVIKKIIKAGKKAEELGAQVVGLGAFTSVVGDKGISVADGLKVPVTTGNSYTVATAVEGTKLAVEKMDYKLEEEVFTVVGATGSIGRAVSLIIAKEVKTLQLVARDQQKLRELVDEIAAINPGLAISTSTDLKDIIKRSRIIISASSAVNALIDPDHLLPGTIVCDVARPRDVAVKIGQQRDDVLVIEGGIVEVPGSVNFNLDFGYPPGTSYACMAETMMLALENRFEDYSLGSEIELDKVEETIQFAQKHGFKLAGLRSFERALSDREIEQIKERARENFLASC